MATNANMLNVSIGVGSTITAANTAVAQHQQRPSKETSASREESDGDDTEDETNEVVEESQDGRWSKRNESVSQRDVPGIDYAYLAMDTEYGFEVVWNEIKLSGGKKFKNENLHNDEVSFFLF
jgi:hypothetical protein